MHHKDLNNELFLLYSIFNTFYFFTIQNKKIWYLFDIYKKKFDGKK